MSLESTVTQEVEIANHLPLGKRHLVPFGLGGTLYWAESAYKAVNDGVSVRDLPGFAANATILKIYNMTVSPPIAAAAYWVIQ